MTRITKRRWCRNGDEGHASVFLIMLMPVVMIVFALVWEAGQMLITKAELLGSAQSAARAGAHQLDIGATLANGVPVLNVDGARQAAADHLRSEGVAARTTVEGERVVVLAHTTYSPTLLPIGVREIEVEVTATALQPPPG